jgi:stress response protein YsnF/sporulation protein YlmC with PRC-barrel domain
MGRDRLSNLNRWKLEDERQDLRGKKLFDESGQQLGTIVDMIVDTDRRAVETVVLDSGTEYPARPIEQSGGRAILHSSSSAGAVHGVTAGRDRESLHGQEERRIPIIEEELKIGKREVEDGGVRVTPHVERERVGEDVTLRHEEVHVHREAADRPVTDADLEALRRGGIEARERHEEPVAQKQARVTGEVVINKELHQNKQRVEGVVERTDVKVEQTKGRKYDHEHRDGSGCC